MPTTGYRFLVVTAGRALVAQRVAAAAAPRRPTGDDFRLVAGFDPPAWLADRVFYQVFPDRFANGDPANDIARRRLDLSRAAHPTARLGASRPSDGPGGSVEFFGGDLAGLEGRLDHLADLGVNAIYLNPVFEARSNHGYDTIDYGRIAAHFGGDEALVVAAPRDARARHPR